MNLQGNINQLIASFGIVSGLSDSNKEAKESNKLESLKQQGDALENLSKYKEDKYTNQYAINEWKQGPSAMDKASPEYEDELGMFNQNIYEERRKKAMTMLQAKVKANNKQIKYYKGLYNQLGGK